MLGLVKSIARVADERLARFWGVGRIQIYKVACVYATESVGKSAAGEHDALNQVADGSQMDLVNNAWIFVVPKGHVESVGAFTIHAPKARLVEKEKVSCASGALFFFWWHRIELRPYPIVIGLLGRGRLFHARRSSMNDDTLQCIKGL